MKQSAGSEEKGCALIVGAVLIMVALGAIFGWVGLGIGAGLFGAILLFGALT